MGLFYTAPEQETVSGSGISCAMCKSAPRRRQSSEKNRTVVRYRRTSTLMVGDGVLTINGVDVADKSSDQVASLLDSTGQRQTTVLTVCRTVATPAPAATGTIRYDTIRYETIRYEMLF